MAGKKKGPDAIPGSGDIADQAQSGAGSIATNTTVERPVGPIGNVGNSGVQVEEKTADTEIAVVNGDLEEAPAPAKEETPIEEDPWLASQSDVRVLERPVYPSGNRTVGVKADDTYQGAHTYIFQNCLGFEDGRTKYDESAQVIQFVKKESDGSTTPGLQSEQLIIALLDRHKKLNDVYPDPRYDRMVACLQGFLQACKERVDERMDRGIMGQLKK